MEGNMGKDQAALKDMIIRSTNLNQQCCVLKKKFYREISVADQQLTLERNDDTINLI